MDVKIIKCFVASPGDTQEERAAVDDVFLDINKTVGETFNFRLESKKWEKDARPQFGSDGQDVINKQLLNEYDVFIGIMYARFGAETPRAGSGTEEEFDQAYVRCTEKNNIELMMYFNIAPINPNNIDLEQFSRVKKFKSKVSDSGGFYKEYSGVTEFKKLLQEHVTAYCLEPYSNTTVKSTNASGYATREAESNAVTKMLDSKLSKALTPFGEQPNIWLEPILSKKADITDRTESNFEKRIDVDMLVESPDSIVIKAPPQFGLTCLARYLILEAWKKQKTWIYLDFRKLDLLQIKREIDNKLLLLNRTKDQISCIVLDSWKSNAHGSKKILKLIDNEFKSVPLIVMQTINDITFREDEPDEKINREFEVLHLLALPRTQIRQVVSEYNANKSLGDDDKILQKVLDDLDVLNIHRTAINCITLLKVSEFNFDTSPTNRTEMIEKVLFVLFNMVQVTEHETSPDLKDCEYILGKFCETLIRNQVFEFEKDDFISHLSAFCEEKLLPLDVNTVFRILFENSIILNIKGKFVFRASFWIYYFAAKRMYADPEFKNFMLMNCNYTSYPEVIEFFTGIDRNRVEIVEKVLADLKNIRAIVDDKVGIENDFNPLNNATWNPSQEHLLELTDELKSDVSNSKLPVEIKDKYADFSYNQLKPYHQTVRRVFEAYSFKQLFHQIAASSKALRNSDYVDPALKKELLKEIIDSWKLVSKVLFALAPVLAENNKVAFDGQGFQLLGDFGDTFEAKLSNIFQSNPINVVDMFRYDLYSNKLGPLLFDYFSKDTDLLSKHQCACVILIERPMGWDKEIENYIVNLRKDSFYLFDLFGQLRTAYQFSFASEGEIKALKRLIKLCIAKHEFGRRRPGLQDLKKISNNVIPVRKPSEQ